MKREVRILKDCYGLQLRGWFNNDFDIGGPEVLSYKNMLLKFAEVRKLKRKIFTIPVMTPKLSSYWLYFVTSLVSPGRKP